MFKNNYFKGISAASRAGGAMAFLFALSGSAFADDSTLGDSFCTLYYNSPSFAILFTMVAYAAGAICVVQAIHHFRLHADSPGNNPIGRPAMLSIGGMCLLAGPSVIKTLAAAELYGSASAGEVVTCAPGASSSASSPSLDTMMTGFINNIQEPLLTLVSVIAILCGIFMILRGLGKASKYGFDARVNSIHSIVTNLLFGSLLVTIGDNENMVLQSMFGQNHTISNITSTLAWGSTVTTGLGGASTSFANAVNACLHFIQLIGAISFVRGWLIMKKVVEGGGNASLAQGLTHIMGGVVAINIFAFLKIMDTTFGTGLLS